MTPPVMNKSQIQNSRARCARANSTNPKSNASSRVRRSNVCICIAICALIFSPGCRQPVTNSQSGRPALFDFSRSRIFGNGAANGGYNSQYAGTRQQQSYLGNQPVSNQSVPSGAFQQQYAQISNEVQRLNQRIGAYDSDNQLLNTEVAALQQKLQLANQYNQTLKDQLGDTSNRIQLSEMEKQAALQQLASAQMQYEQLNRLAQNNSNVTGSGFSNGSPNNGTQSQNRLAGFTGTSAPTQFGGATIRANNSLMQRLSQIQIPGGQARMDGDVIRIEFPSDRVFVPGTYQIQPAQLPVLQNIAGTIRNSFAKNIVGIEAHWDGTPLNPSTTTHHQLTATQSLAVFDNLVRLGLPKNQLFTMAMASNRPRHPQGTAGGISPNRRIELVIYPETYDGSL